jgi:hypothetical protein
MGGQRCPESEKLLLVPIVGTPRVPREASNVSDEESSALA